MFLYVISDAQEPKGRREILGDEGRILDSCVHIITD